MDTEITESDNRQLGLILRESHLYRDNDISKLIIKVKDEIDYEMNGSAGLTTVSLGRNDVFLNFLKKKEFAVINGNKFELTDKGRILKAKGDYKKYTEFIISEVHKEEERKKESDRRDRKLEWIALSQARINLAIAIAAGVASLYYVWQFVKEYWGDYDFSACQSLWVLVGIVVGILSTITWQELTKDKKT